MRGILDLPDMPLLKQMRFFGQKCKHSNIYTKKYASAKMQEWARKERQKRRTK